MATRLYDIAIGDEEFEIGVSVGSAITDAVAITIDEAVVTSKQEVVNMIEIFLQRYLEDDIPPA